MEGKVAITAFGSDAEALFAPHFALASYFLLYDPATNELTAVENTARDLPAGRGVAAADLLIERGVGAVVTQLIGPKPFALLQEKGIKVYPGPRLKVAEILAAVKDGRLALALEAATEEAHAGEHGGCGV
ncbi:MAG: NifB/NifX family molybdenum-iron cluster-binding protein [Bacillota bacterium]